MRKLKIIEHISVDGVIQAPGGPNEDGDYPYGGLTLPYRDPPPEKRSSRPIASHSICCLANVPTISGRASGRRPRAARSRTA